MEEQLQIRRVEGALPGLVDDRLTGGWLEFVDDVPPPLPANEHPVRGAVVTYARADLPRPPTLVRRQVREVGPMALAGMNDKEPELPHDTQQALHGRNTGAGQLDIVAHEVHVAPVAAEI